MMRHEFVEYVGLIEKFEYCKHCDVKKAETTSMWCAEPEAEVGEKSVFGFDPASSGEWRGQDLLARGVWVTDSKQLDDSLLIRLSSGMTYELPLQPVNALTPLPEGHLMWKQYHAIFTSGNRKSKILLDRS